MTNTAHHHELNDPLVDMNTISIRKGRQRLGPQKKRLTTLKKKVLQERLRIWRELNPESVSSSEAKTTSNVQSLSSPVPTHDMDDVRHYYAASSSVCLLNFVQPEDDLDDEEEYQETISDLKSLSLKIGPVREVHILRSGSRHSFVAFSRHLDAQAAAAMWDKMIIGGNKLDATVISNPPLGILDNDDNGNSAFIHQEAHKSWLDFMTQAAASVAHSHASPQSSHTAVNTFPSETTEGTHSLVLENILTQEDLDDEPESLAESLQDITTLANQFGQVAHVKMEENRGGHGPLIHVSYHGDVKVAERAVQQLNGMIIGGETVSAHLSFGSKDETVSKNHVTIILSKVLTEDDFEDEDCLQESIEDIQNIAQQFGQVVHVKAELQGENKGSVLIKYQGDYSITESILEGFSKTVMGGQPISARCLNPSPRLHSGTETVLSTTVILLNILKPEDFESEECLDESLHDIQSIARDKCGQITNLKVERTKDEAGIIHISFKNRQEAEKALEEFNGMVIGGEKIIAQIDDNALSELLPNLEVTMAHTDKSPALSQLSEAEHIKSDAPPPMFSGDKIIPERYAECKRVPKVPNAGVSREYANMRIGDDGAIPVLIDMLGELSRLQNRAKLDKNARARRRFVMGLREVARGIRAHKIIMVIMANNLDEYGALDAKLQEILDLAEAQEEPVPIVFELNKRKLGKALGKSIKVSVVGIQNADGANQQFKQLKKMAINKRIMS
jgi:selenocysteine insertion sequence-binding protein 2